VGARAARAANGGEWRRLVARDSRATMRGAAARRGAARRGAAAAAAAAGRALKLGSDMGRICARCSESAERAIMERGCAWTTACTSGQAA
jgi:hypothetical protein